LALVSACRSMSERVADRRWYAVTAPRGESSPAVHASRVPSGYASGTSRSTSGCSGASTMKVAPKRVSGRVVNTSTASCAPSVVVTGKRTWAPVDQQLLQLVGVDKYLKQM